MTCVHAEQRMVDGWDAKLLKDIHDLHLDPTWIKNHLSHRKGRELHLMHVYRMAIRQEMRKRGLPIRLGT